MANKNQNNNKPNNKSNNNRDNKNEDNPQFQWKKAGKTSFAWILIIITAISLSRFFSSQPNGEVEIEYSDYKNFLTSRSIVKAKIVDEVFYGELNTPQSIILSNGLSKEIQYFRLKLPFIDREVMSSWDNYGLEYSFKQKSPDWTGYFLNFLPWIAILAFWIFIMRRMQGGNGMKSIFNILKDKYG